MVLDTKTLFLIFTLVTVFMSITMLFFWFVQKTYKGFAEWVFTSLLAAVCYVLYLLRGVIPDLFSIIIASSIIPSILVLRLQGSKKYFNRPSVNPAFLMLPLAVLIGYCYFYYIDYDVQLRTFLTTISVTFMAFVIAWEFIRNQNSGSRFLNLTISVLNIIYGLLFFYRGIIILLTPEYQFLKNTAVDSAFFLVAPLFEIAWNVCFIMLNSKRTEEELKQALIFAEEANRSKTRFLGIMSHEMRTPLHSIRGTVQLLDEKINDEKLKPYINLLNRSTLALQRLLDDALDITLIETGRVSLKNESIDTAALMEELTEIFEQQFEDKGLKFLVINASGTPARFTSDRQRILQILANLLNNSLINTSTGEVQLKTGRVYESDAAFICFQVSDTGAGIPSDQLDKIFEPFSMAAARQEGTPQGMGLGLSIVKNLCGLLGGSIEVESEPGRGTLFTVKMPALESAGEDELPEVIDEARLTIPPMFILAVDDVPENLDLLQFYFEDTDATLAEAQTGEDTLEKLASWHFDCLLLDMQLPGIDGISVVKTIRAQEKEHDLIRMPIIAISANAYAQSRKQAIEAGCDIYLARPVGRHELFQAILSLTSDSQCEPRDRTGIPALNSIFPPGLVEKAQDRIKITAQEILKACDSLDAETAGRLGHNIKGLARTFGIPAASDLGEEIELAAHAGDFEKIKNLTGKLLGSII